MTEPAMSAMERSLRRALESGDALDPTFRESIYSASERALERMLSGKAMDETAASGQRARLAETINRVEDEFYERQTVAGAAEDGPAQHDPELSLDPAYADVHGYSTHEAGPPADTHFDDDDGEEFSLQPVFPAPSDGKRPAVAMAVSSFEDGDTAEEPIRPSARARGEEAVRKATQRSRSQVRPFLAIGLVVLMVICAGLWFLFGHSRGSGRAGADTSWIDLFDGRRLEAVATPDGGRMEALNEGEGEKPAVRFTPAGAGSSIAVAIGRGVAQEIDGRSVGVELTAGSPDGAARSFEVRCLMDGADICGQKVFTTARRSETFNFAMTVPTGASGGSFRLSPVPPDARGDLDLFGLRLKSEAS